MIWFRPAHEWGFSNFGGCGFCGFLGVLVLWCSVWVCYKTEFWLTLVVWVGSYLGVLWFDSGVCLLV